MTEMLAGQRKRSATTVTHTTSALCVTMLEYSPSETFFIAYFVYGDYLCTASGLVVEQ